MQLIASACGQPQTNHVSLHEHPYTIPSLPPDEKLSASLKSVNKALYEPQEVHCMFVCTFAVILGYL